MLHEKLQASVLLEVDLSVSPEIYYRCRTLVPLSVSLWNDPAAPVFDGVELAGFKSRANVFIGLSWSIPTIVFYYFFIFLLPVYRLVLWGLVLRTDRVYITLSQPCMADLF